MNSEIKTYNAMFDYEYVSIDGIDYVECLDTGDKFFTWYDKQLHKRFSTYDNEHVNSIYEAIDNYEAAHNAAWEKDYRRNRETSNGMIIS